MMKIKHILRYLAIFIFLIAGSCQSKEATMKNKWKYLTGHTFGDHLDFTSESWKVKNDTIYNAEKPFAIVGMYPGRLNEEKQIILRTLDGRFECIYTEE